MKPAIKKRLIMILPGVLSLPGHESALAELSSSWKERFNQGKVFRTSPTSGTRELSWLGLNPGDDEYPSGPLIVASFGVDPPPSSVQFALDILSVDEEGALHLPLLAPTREEMGELRKAFDALQTPKLTPIVGSGLEHGLVWENGSLDIDTKSPQQAQDKNWLDALPNGDKDRVLLQFIDDSYNLLASLEFNHVRFQEGQQPLNIFWPWGQGFPPNMQNLAFSRGEPVTVITPQRRLKGLSRLVGYFSSLDQPRYQGVHWSEATMAKISANDGTQLVHMGQLASMMSHRRIDEVIYALDQVMTKVIEPWEVDAQPYDVLLLAEPPDQDRTASDFGLALVRTDGMVDPGKFPFDERVLDDKRVPLFAVHELLSRFYTMRIQEQ